MTQHTLPKFFQQEAHKPLVQQHHERVQHNTDVISRYKEQLRLNAIKRALGTVQ